MTIIIILFVLLAAVLLLPSQISQQKKNIQEVEDSLAIRMHQLKQDFKFRTKELERRLKSNELAQDEWQALSSELQLDTTAAIESTQNASRSSHSNFSPITAGIMLISTLIIGVGMYQYSGGKTPAKQQMKMVERLKNNPDTITDIAQKLKDVQDIKDVKSDTAGKGEKSVEGDKAESISSQEILEELFLAMRTKIDINPNDADAWRAFAMFSARVGQENDAYTALKRAISLTPNNVDIHIELAQLYASSKDPKEKLKANRILFRVIDKNPEHEGARLILGFNAFSLGMYDVAIKSWNAILIQREPGSSSAKMLEKSIAVARGKLNDKLNEQSNKQSNQRQASGSTNNLVNDDTQTSDTLINGVNPNGSSISVKVVLPDSVKKKLTGNESLFVFAKAVDGPRFPVAVVKLAINALNSEILLTDDNAMQAQFSLSKFSKVQVSARISLTGNAIAQAGDIDSQKVILEAPYSNSKVLIRFEEHD